MYSKNIYLILGIASLLITVTYMFSSTLKQTGYSINEINTQSLELKFSELSNAKTNLCAGPNVLDRLNTERLQGSCCSPMDFHRYSEQINGLKKYAYIAKIPADPYDID